MFHNKIKIFEILIISKLKFNFVSGLLILCLISRLTAGWKKFSNSNFMFIVFLPFFLRMFVISWVTWGSFPSPLGTPLYIYIYIYIYIYTLYISTLEVSNGPKFPVRPAINILRYLYYCLKTFSGITKTIC